MLPSVLPPELGAFRNELGQTRRCLNHLNHQHHATPHNGKSWLHTARCCWRWEGEGEAIFSVCDTCVEPVGSHWVAVRWPVWVQLGSVSECAIGVTRMFGVLLWSFCGCYLAGNGSVQGSMSACTTTLENKDVNRRRM